MKKIEDLAKKGSELMQNGQYMEAAKIYDKVLKIQADHLYAVYGKAYSLAVVRNRTSLREEKEDLTAKVWQLCEKLIEITPEQSLFPYLEEHKFPRDTLRFAYNGFAWYTYEKAETEGELQQALDYIEHCLSITSPIDDEWRLFPYIDTKVRILLKLDRTEEAYRLVQSVLKKDPEFDDFQDIRCDPEYKNWISGGNFDKFLKGKDGETAHEALMRLQEYIEKFGHQYYEDGLEFSKLIPLKDIEKIESKLNTQLPPSYKDFLTKHGTFCIDGRNYRLLTPKEALKESQEQWKIYEKMIDEEDLYYDDIKKIKRLFFFQYQMYESDQYIFYMDDIIENGEMSVHSFYHDDSFVFNKKRRNFDMHMSNLVDQLISEDND